MRIALITLVLLAVCTKAPGEDEWKPPRFTESDRAVLGVLRARVPEAKHLARVHRTEATPELDLVVAFGQSDDGGGSGHWANAFGAFLQRRDRPSLVYELSARSFQDTPKIVVQRSTPTDLVLSVSDSDGKGTLPTEKLVFDPRAKALVRHFQYEPWTLGRAFPHGSGAVFLATDHNRVVAFGFDPTRERPFEMLSTDEAMRWSKRVRVSEGTVGYERKRDIRFGPDTFEPVAFGKKGSFRLTEWAQQDPDQKTLTVAETRGGETKHYSIPQSTAREYRTMRDDDRFETDPGTYYIDEAIGGWDVEDGTLWVGKDFYDSEGSTGIGAFGWFDEEARTFRLSSPPEVRDCSITAMRVEKDAIWMALVHHWEYGASSAGLARYDRATKAIRILPQREPGKQFLRIGDSLLLVTSSSVVLVSNDGLRSFFIDQTSDGRLRVAEAVGAEP
jgi:hypothetical protein